jgi:tetratricopeptide (TPR) repeat protein
VIGPYKLLEQIGEGGFGVVFMAEQTQPVRRKVALKVLKPGMDSRPIIARFEAERQALALMEHPHIAQVLDGGATPSGRPYFVMELVRGIPITAFCDQHQLPVRARLALFVSVCQAVQHAHQKGIIHRDLKPSNVLVTLHDGTPVVKVIDFGIAKALGQQLTDKTLFTGFAQMIGTPLYMSPEQAGMSGLDVDTRSDVYSLGVLLYELLTGTTPFDEERLRQAGYDEMRRIIREEEPPKPSTRLSTLGQAATTVSTQRQSHPKRLSQLFRGELDWIVMKALEKDRNRRYETANGLARDLERYLHDEPVLAGPPGAMYRLKKTFRRHRILVLASGLVLLALVAGTAVSTWQAIRARRAERTARMEHEIATAVNDYLRDDLLGQASAFNQAGPNVSPDRDIKLRDVLDRASARVGERFAEQPLVDAALRRTIGAAYRDLGEYAKARPHLQRALELRAGQLGERHPDTLDAMSALATLYFQQGQPAENEALQRRILQIAEKDLGEGHVATRHAMGNLALCLVDKGQLAEAEALMRRSLDIHYRVFGEDHPETFFAIRNLAWFCSKHGRLEEAEELDQKCLAGRRRVLGSDHPLTLSTMSALAALRRAQGHLDEADALSSEAADRCVRVLGPEHSTSLNLLHDRAVILYHRGDYRQAERVFSQVLAARQRVLSKESPQTLTTMHNLAATYNALQKRSEAEALFVQVLEIKRRKLGKDHPDTLDTMHMLAGVHLEQGHVAKAEAMYLETLELKRRKFGEDNPSTGQTLSNLATVYLIEGKPAQAEPLLLTALEGARHTLGEEHPQTVRTTLNLAGLAYRFQGKHAQAEPLLRKCLEIQRRHPNKDQPAQALSALANNLLDQQQYAEAELLLRECLSLRNKNQPQEWTAFNDQSLLGGVLLGQKRYAEAEPLLLQGHMGLKKQEAKIPPLAKFRLTESLDRLVQLYDAWGKEDKAAEWRKRLSESKQDK